MIFFFIIYNKARLFINYEVYMLYIVIIHNPNSLGRLLLMKIKIINNI